MRTLFLIIIASVLISSCTQTPKNNETTIEPEAISLLGNALYSSEPSEKLMEKYNYHKSTYAADTNNADNYYANTNYS